MTDDRGQFEPETAWAAIKKQDAAREFEAKHPTKWWHGVYFTFWGGAAIVGLIVSVVGLVLWLFSAPFA